MKKSLLSIIALLAFQFSFGQITFSHSIGGSYYYSSLAAAPGIMYSPRLNLYELGDEATISLGTHLGLGMSFNSRGGDNSFAFDLPIVAEINFGQGAHPETSSSFGGFAGLGYGISNIGSSGEFGGDINKASGVVFNAGLRAIVQEYPVGVRVSYLLNTKEGYKDVISLGIFYTFGDF